MRTGTTDSPHALVVYIIECKDAKLYTGITNDLERRIKEHNYGNGCRFTKYRTPVKLLYAEDYPTRQEVLRREAQIKRLTRRGKLELIKGSLRPLSGERDTWHFKLFP